MTTFITIKYNNKTSRILKDHVATDDLAQLFSVRLEGMHLKYKTIGQSQWGNIWPSNGLFNIPDFCEDAYLIAVNETHEVTERISTLAPQLSSSFCRRGNAAQFSGSRPIPSYKRNIPVPLKKKKTESSLKLFLLVTLIQWQMKLKQYLKYQLIYQNYTLYIKTLTSSIYKKKWLFRLGARTMFLPIKKGILYGTCQTPEVRTISNFFLLSIIVTYNSLLTYLRCIYMLFLYLYIRYFSKKWLTGCSRKNRNSLINNFILQLN